MYYRRVFSLMLFPLLFLQGFLVADVLFVPPVLESLYGEEVIDEPVIIDLLHSRAMERLKEVDQHGTFHYFAHVPAFSRYDHSVGVYLLLKRYGASEQERVAGLLHDASHTVFSHVGDHVFHHRSHGSSYQDDIHAWSLEQQGVEKVLAKHDFTIDQVLHKKGGFTLLEQNLPDMCADRIDYNLQTAFRYGLLTAVDIHMILEDLRYEEGRWYFTDPAIAKRFAMVSLHFTPHLWGSLRNFVIYHWTAEAINRAIEQKILVSDDIHFGRDREVLDRLLSSLDPVISDRMWRCQHVSEAFKLTDASNYTASQKPKFRVIDPLVRVKRKFRRLTELDSSFAQKYERVRKMTERGWYIAFGD